MRTETGIQAVSLDVGGTLIDPWPSVGHVYAAVAAEFGLAPFDPAWLNVQFAAAWRAKAQFHYTRAEWADLVVSTCRRPACEIGLASPFFERLYTVFSEARVWRVHDDVLPTIHALRRAGLKLAVISNWDDRLRLLLRNLELDRFFDTIQISGEVGAHKPSPDIFRRAHEALALPPEAMLHVGDSLREDFEGAQRAGLRALWLRRGQTLTGAGQIQSLRDVATAAGLTRSLG